MDPKINPNAKPNLPQSSAADAANKLLVKLGYVHAEVAKGKQTVSVDSGSIAANASPIDERSVASTAVQSLMLVQASQLSEIGRALREGVKSLEGLQDKGSAEKNKPIFDSVNVMVSGLEKAYMLAPTDAQGCLKQLELVNKQLKAVLADENLPPRAKDSIEKVAVAFEALYQALEEPSPDLKTIQQSVNTACASVRELLTDTSAELKKIASAYKKDGILAGTAASSLTATLPVAVIGLAVLGALAVIPSLLLLPGGAGLGILAILSLPVVLVVGCILIPLTFLTGLEASSSFMQAQQAMEKLAENFDNCSAHLSSIENLSSPDDVEMSEKRTAFIELLSKLALDKFNNFEDIVRHEYETSYIGKGVVLSKSAREERFSNILKEEIKGLGLTLEVTAEVFAQGDTKASIAAMKRDFVAAMERNIALQLDEIKRDDNQAQFNLHVRAERKRRAQQPFLGLVLEAATSL